MELINFTIIIPTYKRAETLERAINSVINQEDVSFEIIVVDDNDPKSEERLQTESVMTKFLMYDNVLYLKHDSNKNGAVARNTGLKVARGEYITFLDDDDEFMQTRLAIIYNEMIKLEEKWGIAYTLYTKQLINGGKHTSNENSDGDMLVYALMRSLYIGSGSNMVFRKEVIQKVGFFDESFLRNQDLEYLVRALFLYKIKHIPYNLLLIHEDGHKIKYSYEQHIRREKQFEEKFKPLLDQISNKDKLRVKKMYGLDRFRLAFRFKKYKEAFSILRDHNVGLKTFIRYVCYLSKRFITKKSYGFKL